MRFSTTWLCRNVIACLLAGGLSLLAYAQEIPGQYQLYTANEGLPQNYLLALAQDSAGFIWVGTKDGLARYDGYTFKIYRSGKDTAHSPAFNSITNLYTDRRGYVWIQYDNRAVDCYNPATGIFEHISGQRTWDGIRDKVTAYELIVDHHDNLWLITEKGMYRYHIPSKQLSPFALTANLVPKAIMEDHSGKIWMVMQDAFNVYDYSKNQVQHIPFQLSKRITFGGRKDKWGVGETESGKIVVTSLDSIALFYDPSTRSFQTVTLKPKYTQLHDAGLGNTNLVVANNGDRWFTRNGSIFRIDKRTDSITALADPTNTALPDVSALLVDRSGTLWFGKNARGLCKINLNATQFVSKKYTYQNFETDILVNELGIALSDLPFPIDNPTIGYLFRHAADTVNKLIWLQNYLMERNVPALHAYDIKRRKLISLPVALDKNSEVGISIDNTGSLWLMGINSWELYKVTVSEGKSNKQVIPVPSLRPDSLFGTGKVAINPVVDKEMMWVMASNMSVDFGLWSLAAIHLKTKEVRWYTLKPDNAEPASSLLMMINDPFNPRYIWIGTTGNGLIRFDKTTGQSHAFTTDDGLPNNTIYAIVPDNNNNLWLSSNRGITRFNTTTHTVRNFDVTDGLAGNEFNRWHCFQLPDARIAFGGVSGYTIFNPADIKEDEFQPRVLLSNLLINNKAIPDSSELSGGSLHALDKIQLPYDQNFLSFEFASDEYNRPQKISYRYRLTNFDNDWVYARTDRVANYTKLPPGKYTLEINAANISGIWSNNIKTLQVIIIPPWWQTWWAYSLYILIALGMLLAFFYYRVRRIQLKQEMILQQKQTEQLKAVDEMKSRFFSNITHEFRTPLSLIISPVEKLQAEVKDEYTRKTLLTIQGNANRLLQLINQLLDLSKLEAGNMQLNFSRGRLDEFIGEMITLFIPLADQRHIDLRFHCTLSQEYVFEADKLKTILLNLLSNAVKFTPSNGEGKIQVTVMEEEGKIKLTVKDNGVGIAANKLPFIFDRFFQADDSRTRQYEGTGIGLALVKELTGLMNGTVTAESEPNAGTSITLIFPAEKAGNSTVPRWQKEVSLISTKNITASNGHKKENTGSDLPLLLLVEDNKELLDFLQESFSKNFRVLTANNGVTALQLAKEELPDLVISDVMMPEMDGYALCQQLKTDTATSHIAVILLTAKISYESRLSGLQLGADDYINKPFHFDELETRIRNLLDHQEKQRLYYRAQLEHKDDAVPSITPGHPFLQQVYAIIDDMIDDPQLGASKLAEKNAMSLRTLNRKLNTTIGMTAGDLIRQYRLQKSLILLKEGMNVSEAAYKVGFETPAYFSQCFKEQYGVSPKEWLRV